MSATDTAKVHATIYLWVALGSACGGVARLALSEAVGRSAGGTFPWGTMAVNVLGSLAIGWLAHALSGDGRAGARAFWIVGVLGGFTTFSAFSLQTVGLVEAGQWARALANVGGSISLCCGAAWVGGLLGAAWSRV